MKPLAGQTNWHRCALCGRPVTRVKIKGGEVIVLSRTPAHFVIDEKGDELFWYNKHWVRGRRHFDGLKGYKKHRCYRT